MSNNENELLPLTTRQETLDDIAAILASIPPMIGGPISAVLAGISQSRKLERVRDVLEVMAKEIKDLKSEVSEKYVRTEDFEDLLEKTLRQVADERNDEKRKAYAAFLANDIRSPGKPYDEKIRILRTLEEVQADHIRMLKALRQEPDRDIRGYAGSVIQTLQKRLPDISRERITDLAQQLTVMQMADLSRINTMMTARGAEELQHTVTPYGRNFIQYIISD